MCGFVALFPMKTLSQEKFQSEFHKITHRGPDDHQIIWNDSFIFGFHRLSIMDLSDHGRQPFVTKSGNHLMCNGEIYNYLDLKKEIIDLKIDYEFHSHSDCEVLLPMYEKFGIKDFVLKLDGEFAFVIYDQELNKFIAARDPMGIRPLFYGYDSEGKIMFASEMKAIHQLCEKVLSFPPGYYFDGEKMIQYHAHDKKILSPETNLDVIYLNIRKLLESAVVKRLQSDAEVGFLLSGGLDSSLVCAIAAKHLKKPIRTFSIGMSDDAIDSKYAEEVAKFIGAKHTSVVMTKEEVLGSLREVIQTLETWDITTIRASIGMYLVCEYIKKNTNIKVLLTGEVSDELFGYKYTDFAPNAVEFQKEAEKRVRELYLYDVLRADRSISAHSLEARVPFSDKEFVDFVMKIDPELKMNKYKMGKFLLRHSFDKSVSGMTYLPDSILYREKAAFSDAVGHSMVDYLKEYAESMYTEQEFLDAQKKYSYKMPFTKESLLYREIFEEFYPKRAELIKDFWMPNSNWENCKVSDPSARVLKNYGNSGK